MSADTDRLHLRPRRPGGRALVGLTLLLLSSLGACANLPAPAKVVLTPLTVVRDVVDAPFTSLANVFEHWAEGSHKEPKPNIGVGIGSGGVKPKLGINLGYWGFKPFSWLFGGIDWLVGRSVWPHWPTGISPWKRTQDSWGSLYFPSTRELWRDEAERAAWDAADPR